MPRYGSVRSEHRFRPLRPRVDLLPAVGQGGVERGGQILQVREDLRLCGACKRHSSDLGACMVLRALGPSFGKSGHASHYDRNMSSGSHSSTYRLVEPVPAVQLVLGNWDAARRLLNSVRDHGTVNKQGANGMLQWNEPTGAIAQQPFTEGQWLVVIGNAIAIFDADEFAVLFA